jgi:hypothetical protein
MVTALSVYSGVKRPFSPGLLVILKIGTLPSGMLSVLSYGNLNNRGESPNATPNKDL